MGYFSRRREQLAKDVTQAVMQAVEERLAALEKPRPADMADMGAKMLGGMTDFLKGAGDIALRGAASAFGQRGGKATQAKRRQKIVEAAQQQREGRCPLCIDPGYKYVTTDMIYRHREHEHGRSNARTEDATAQPQEHPETSQSGLFAKQAIGYNGPGSAEVDS